jgi:ribosomal protein S27AE
MPKKGKKSTSILLEKKGKKHTILGGIKVSSKQLSEWGSLGGRPRKWTNEAERKRAERLRKKQEKFGEKAELREYRSYGEIQIKKISITCPNCGKVETDLSKYFNEQGKYIPETWWFDTVKWEKKNVRENRFFCVKCSWSFSFFGDNLKVKEVRETSKRAGSGKERMRRFREKKPPTGSLKR